VYVLSSTYSAASTDQVLLQRWEEGFHWGQIVFALLLCYHPFQSLGIVYQFPPHVPVDNYLLLCKHTAHSTKYESNIGLMNKTAIKYTPGAINNIDTMQAQRNIEQIVIHKPSRPLSAYNIFFREERRRIVKEKGAMPADVESGGGTVSGKVAFANMGKAIASRWNALDVETKHHYQELASHEKSKYRKAVSKWRKLSKAAEDKRKLTALMNGTVHSTKTDKQSRSETSDLLTDDSTPSLASSYSIETAKVFHSDYLVEHRIDPSRAAMLQPDAILSPTTVGLLTERIDLLAFKLGEEGVDSVISMFLKRRN